MELICPSCEARYQVPDSSVGEKGRQVSCMNCGHAWHAFPPLILGSAAAPAAGVAGGIDRQPAPARGGAPDGPVPAAGPAAGSGSGGAAGSAAGASAFADRPRMPEPSRSEQLAEIREMLAEVQSEDRAAAAIAPDDDDDRTRIPAGAGAGADRRAALGSAHAGAPDESARPAPATAARPAEQPAAEAPSRDEHAHAARADADDEDDGDDDTAVDPLRRRMALHQKQGERGRGADVDRLRRRHDRRARRSRRARETGSGAFLTGFLLIVMIAAVMTALYLLAPQIAERMPGTEAMLAEYVTTIDGFRVSVGETVETVRDWVLGLIEKV